MTLQTSTVRSAVMSGVHEGRDAVLQALGQIGESFESFHVSADEMVEQGDTVVVLSHVEARTKSGNEVKVPGAGATQALPKGHAGRLPGDIREHVQPVPVAV